MNKGRRDATKLCDASKSSFQFTKIESLEYAKLIALSSFFYWFNWTKHRENWSRQLCGVNVWNTSSSICICGDLREAEIIPYFYIKVKNGHLWVGDNTLLEMSSLKYAKYEVSLQPLDIKITEGQRVHVCYEEERVWDWMLFFWGCRVVLITFFFHHTKPTPAANEDTTDNRNPITKMQQISSKFSSNSRWRRW